MFAAAALINYQLIWRGGGVKGGVWVVGGRSSLINVSNRFKRTPLRVIRVNLAWHTGRVDAPGIDVWEASVLAVDS